MPETFPFEKRYWYPHMMPYDVAIWERFIEKYPDAYDFVSYDVKVGSGPAHDTVVNPETGGDSINLYKRKIDVVGYKGERIDIIELKPRAGSSALGQVAGYGVLYKKDYTPPTEPNLVVITDQLGTDMDTLSSSMGVKLIVV